ncbi:MAG: acyltransferase [Deltaproteobacteria bacterium]|nr:acyltransferase [Deltaproteobacteria bacterium]
MKVGFVQFNPRFGDISGNIEQALGLAESADAELLVLPELFNTGYLFASPHEVAELSEEVPGGRTTEALSDLARRKKAWIIGGLAERDSDVFYNSAVLAGPDGYHDTYRKIHLFSEEKKWFQPGNRGFRVYDIGECTIGIMICFDWIFPESVRTLSLMGAQVICHAANLVLPYCQESMKTRCLENRVFSITANRTGTETRGGQTLSYTGRSRIIAPDTEVLHTAGEDTDEAGVVDIDPERALDKQLNPYNNLFGDRRVEFYGRLLKKQGGR